MASTAAIAQVETRSFTFENEGVELSGTLYLPERYSGDALPTVIVTGAWTSVEEQMPQVYAEQMVERGFAAFTFDFRGWGKSGDLFGNLRYLESPQAKTSDIRAAFSLASTLREGDASQLHGLSICASAGYMMDAAAGNDLVASWLQYAQIVEAVYGGREGAEGVLMPIGGYHYDPERGAIPQYDNKWSHASWEGWLTYYPVDHANRLTQSLAIVHSKAAAIPQGVHRFLEGFAGTSTLQMLEDVTQFDFYDNPEDVTRASDTVAAHFNARHGGEG